jgi:chitinase
MSLRNVIYYNAGNDQIPLGVGLNQLPYTDVIVANLQPKSATDRTLIGWGTAFDKELQNNVRWLQRAGKNVLISFGGVLDDQLTTAAYQYWAANSGNLTALVKQLVDFVYYYNFNGVDIDYEDDAGFGNNAAYDGVAFLRACQEINAQSGGYAFGEIV